MGAKVTRLNLIAKREKAEQTTRAATAIITAETTAATEKAARLRALRLSASPTVPSRRSS